MVNPDIDGRGGTGDAAEEPGRCCGLHPPARSHDWHWVQLPQRPQAQILIPKYIPGMRSQQVFQPEKKTEKDSSEHPIF